MYFFFFFASFLGVFYIGFFSIFNSSFNTIKKEICVYMGILGMWLTRQESHSPKKLAYIRGMGDQMVRIWDLLIVVPRF